MDFSFSDDQKLLRDNIIKSRGLETDAFPTATFELTQPVELPEGIDTAGASVPFSATGNLTLHGVTKAVTLDFDARLVRPDDPPRCDPRRELERWRR